MYNSASGPDQLFNVTINPVWGSWPGGLMRMLCGRPAGDFLDTLTVNNLIAVSKQVYSLVKKNNQTHPQFTKRTN